MLGISLNIFCLTSFGILIMLDFFIAHLWIIFNNFIQCTSMTLQLDMNKLTFLTSSSLCEINPIL